MGRDGRVPGNDDNPHQAQAPLLAELPPAGTLRWMPRRKALVVAAVRGGALSLEAACQRYALTVEEFLSWQRAVDKFGVPGLRIADRQEHRAELR
ncbi:MAG TPA: DUF1153 domain-containing protein [Rhizomicrobium sp.]|jgi:hypothetical protein|nr:DUF1153 domain-containing protein [Rhizomicrobium sp.]